MPTKEEMIKGLDSMNELLKIQAELRRDGLIFLYDKGLWEEVMKYHCEQTVKRMEKKWKKELNN